MLVENFFFIYYKKNIRNLICYNCPLSPLLKKDENLLCTRNQYFISLGEIYWKGKNLIDYKTLKAARKRGNCKN